MASALRRTVRSSELSRNSAAVFAAAEEGPVNITRRDGDDLVLAKSEHVERERRAFRVAANVVAASLSQTGQPLGERLRRQFPWMEFLGESDRETFATEIMDTARACAAVSRFERILVVFEAWRSTAEAIAAGYTCDDELDWIEEPAPVGHPRQGG